MPLFEVALLKKPTRKEVEEGTAKEELVFGPEPVVAKDTQSAAIAAVMKSGAKVDMERVEVLVRPFA